MCPKRFVARIDEPSAYAMQRLHITVRGRVQGVFFRQSVVEKADSLGLAGWVRNRHDGAVEVVAEGPPDALEILRAYCAHGPSGATVQNIDVSAERATGEFSGFRVRGSA